MFTKRLLITSLLAIAAWVGGSQRADAGLRVRLDSGAETQWFYTTSDTFLASGVVTIGAYTGTVETTVTNFPGTAIAGTMSQTINIGSVGAAPAALSAQSWVVNDATLGGLTPGLITNAAQIALLSAAAEKPFTAPPGGQPFNVTSDAGSSTNITVSAGTAVATTTVDGTSVLSAIHNLVTGNEAMNTGTVPDNPGTNAYTLNQLLVLSGVNSTASGFNVTGSSSVTSTPAPAGLILAATAIPFIGLIRRRMRKAELTTAA